MTHPSDIEGFEKRIVKTGRPEWDSGGRRFVLERGAGGWLARGPGHRYGGHISWSSDSGSLLHLHDHIAACLLREHFRVWLFERQAEVESVPIVPGPNYVVWLRLKNVGIYDTYDGAQAAAIDAVIADEKEKEDETESETV